MNEQQRHRLEQQDQIERQKGRPYYPYAAARDAFVALIIFLILVGLSAFMGGELQPPANPADASYVPLPEWFFLFFYEIVKYFPGNLAVIAVVGFPTIVFGGLFLLPWLDRTPSRHPRDRAGVLALMTFGWVVIFGFTVLSATISTHHTLPATQPLPGINVASQPDSVGQKLYVDNCGGCHGEYGEGGPNPAEPGDILAPISSAELLLSFTDDTLFNIISNGFPTRGMTGFSQATGGPLDDRQIEQIVAYIRAWEANPPVVSAYIPPASPPLTTGDITAFTPSASLGDVVRGAEIYDAWCANCHGPDGTNPLGEKDIVIVDVAYLEGTTDEIMVEAIQTGFPNPNKMPAFRTILDSQEISDVLAWMRQFNP
jgi:mono/diheme cytochrome c family protein